MDLSITSKLPNIAHDLTRDELMVVIAQIWNLDPTIVTQGMYLAMGMKAHSDYPLN